MTYINQLTRLSDKQNKANQLKVEAAAIQQRQQERRTKPLTEQITELMQSIPPAIRDSPWTMSHLVSRLQGKYKDRPHAQQVGEALRKLSWRRQRVWTKGFDGVRLWLPPTHLNSETYKSCQGE